LVSAIKDTGHDQEGTAMLLLWAAVVPCIQWMARFPKEASYHPVTVEQIVSESSQEHILSEMLVTVAVTQMRHSLKLLQKDSQSRLAAAEFSGLCLLLSTLLNSKQTLFYLQTAKKPCRSR